MAVNVFAGSVIILALAAPLAAGIVLLYAVPAVIAHLFPQTAHYTGAIFVGFLGIPLLLGASRHLRGRRWRALFLNFALAAGMALFCYQSIRSSQDCDIPFALLTIYVLTLPMSSDRDVERRSFLLSAPLYCLAVLLNTGALGSGQLFRGANFFLNAGVGLWLFIWLRKRLLDNNVSSNATSTI